MAYVDYHILGSVEPCEMKCFEIIVYLREMLARTCKAFGMRRVVTSRVGVWR